MFASEKVNAELGHRVTVAVVRLEQRSRVVLTNEATGEYAFRDLDGEPTKENAERAAVSLAREWAAGSLE